MKHVFILLITLLLSFTVQAEDRFHIRVLEEISYRQAQVYPKQWEISTYTYTNPQNVSTTRYFIFAQAIKHNSDIVIDTNKQLGSPWRVLIDGMTYFADFDNDEDLKKGDHGILKYNGDKLYFIREN